MGKTQNARLSIDDLLRMRHRAQKEIKDLETGISSALIKEKLKINRRIVRDCNTLINLKRSARYEKA